jgi:formylglycine-generating enzyme required for sulfatase activity/serine/threonine protein kinase
VSSARNSDLSHGVRIRYARFFAKEETVPGTDTLKLVGRTIADKYAVEGVVGEGGFATVYKATHILWKRPVALKVFKALSEWSASDRQRLLDEFIQEGALLADLSARTAAIVQARDIGMLETANGERVPYMVLEWLEGGTLEAVLEDEKRRGLAPRTIADTVRLIEPAAEALALAHRKGIAHRDVKPGNIFVIGDPRGDVTVKLLDFGIAKVVSDMQKIAGSFAKTSGHVTSFTPAYGAPEQFSRTHGATGPWTDVFALALVMVETMTGREPLEGDDFLQLGVAAGRAERRPTPRTLGATVSDEVERIFLKALAVNPTDRWPLAGDFWNALREAMRMDPLRMTADPTPRRVTPSRAPLATAPTVASASATDGPPSLAVTASRSRATGTSTTTHPSGAGKMGLFVGLGIGAVIVIGAAVALLGARGPMVIRAAVAPDLSSAGVAHTASLPSGVPKAVAAATAGACPRDMIAIPGGSFFMGSDEGLPIEKPAHQVVVSPYCIDEFEVTVDKYKGCSDGGRCKRAGVTNQWDDLSDKDRKAFDGLCNARDPVDRGRHPINCVDWDMADKFCREQGGRLPTEAEWEFAARGPDGRKYPWGDDDPSADRLNACGRECVLWGAKNGVEEKAMYDADDGFPNTAPVGSFPKGASRYGVQDVVGNVWEWVADWYAAYGAEEQKSPSGPPTGTEKVIRGGACNGSYASWVRPTFRYKDSPTKRSYGIGFRCAK